MKHDHEIAGIKRNRLVSTLMSNHDSSANNGQPFKLKSSSEFAVRSQDVFEGLKNLEKVHEEKNPETKHDPTPEKEPQQLQSVVDMSDCFKKPLSVAPRRKRYVDTQRSSVPDYVKHPKKWTKYSLTEVPEHTDEANNRAAMVFLKGVQPQKQTSDTSGKIAFSRPSRKSTESSKSKSRSRREKRRARFLPSGTGSVVLMPEVLVGRKHRHRSHRKKHSSESKEKSSKKKEVHLPHLHQESDGVA